MVNQDSEKKVLKVEDPTLEQVQPSTRNLVNDQNPGVTSGVGADPDAQAKAKYSASYAAMKDAQLRAAQEMQAAREVVQPPVNPTPAPQPVQAASAPQEQLQSDLSLLVTTGQIREEYVVGGFKFVLRTLTAKENNEVLAAVANTDDDLGKLGALRICVLARAIDTVNGVPLEHCPGGDSGLQGMARRENLLGLFQLQMIVKLFDHYAEMLERSEAVFNNAVEDEEVLKN